MDGMGPIVFNPSLLKMSREQPSKNPPRKEVKAPDPPKKTRFEWMGFLPRWLVKTQTTTKNTGKICPYAPWDTKPDKTHVVAKVTKTPWDEWDGS